MTDKFADRAFVTINGYEWQFLKTAKASIDDAVTLVDTMSRDYRSAGTKNGNKKYDLTLECEIPALQAQLDANIADPGSNVNAVFECGGERYTFHNVFRKSVNMSGSVGDASKSLDFGALDCTNENGASVDTLLNIALA